MTTFVIWPFVLVAVPSSLVDCCTTNATKGYLATRGTVVTIMTVTSQWTAAHRSSTLFLGEKGPKSPTPMINRLRTYSSIHVGLHVHLQNSSANFTSEGKDMMLPCMSHFPQLPVHMTHTMMSSLLCVPNSQHQWSRDSIDLSYSTDRSVGTVTSIFLVMWHSQSFKLLSLK